MDNPTRSTQPAAKSATPVAPIKGSWEDLLYRGQQLLATQNQEGSAILQSLVDRLAQMPPALLNAGNHRLKNVLIAAVNSVTPYHLYSQRYDDALANIDLCERIDDQTESISWRTYRAMVLMQSGAFDEAFDIMSEIARSGRFGYWQYQVTEAIRRRRLDLAEKVIAEVEHTLNRLNATATDADELRHQRASLAYCKALVSVVQGKTSEASAWMEYTLAQDAQYFAYLSLFYVRLIEHDDLTEALNWVKRDRAFPVRAGFWHGYICHRLGKSEEAGHRWQQVVKSVATEKDEEADIELLEYVMAHYYLGDREGAGLALSLELMEPGKLISPLQFFLAGVGWAMRGNSSPAHVNFQQAVMRLQSQALAHKMQSLWWRFCTDLVAADALPQYAKYFDQPETHSI